MQRTSMRASTLIVCGLSASVALGCAPSGGHADPDGATPPPTIDASSPDAPSGGPPYSDFPAAPVLNTGAPADAPMLFGMGGTATGGPCLIEPEIGTLFPNNWLRPRFTLVPAPGENLFEIRLHVDSQVNDLVIYSTTVRWTMDADIWRNLSKHIGNDPIEVTVRGATWNGTQLTVPPAMGTTGTIRIAPVDATGAIVYWTTSGGTALKGFVVGSEDVREVLRPAQTSALCIGCHSSTPDGKFVGFSASESDWSGEPSRVDMRAVDGTAAQPPFLTATASALLTRQRQQAPVFSKAHWSAGDRVALNMFEVSGVTNIAWTDLEATSNTQGVGWGLLARSGDTRNAAAASWSHDGKTIAYVSTTVISSGVANSAGDIYTVPYNDRQGGAATPLPGASSPAFNEFYPSWSADDALLAFSRVPDTGNSTSGWTSYNNPQSEVFVIPPAGGQPLRLAANDPPFCTSRPSPGVTNSWPKWSPGVQARDGKTYYWLTFSSTRGPDSLPQIYATAVVVDGSNISTYPAMYLWNQPANEANHTPAWDNYQIN